VDLSGQSDQVLATLGSVGPTILRWTPDGNHLYFARNDSLFAVSASGGAPCYRGAIAGKATYFDLHRGNGRLLKVEKGAYPYHVGCNPLYCTCQDGTMLWTSVALRDTSTGDTRYHFRLPGAFATAARWSYDGTRVAFSSDRNYEGVGDILVGKVTPNHAPRFSEQSVTDGYLPACDEFERVLTATDPDSETVTFQAVMLPAGAVFANHTLTWTPDSTQVGNHYIVLRALDGSGGLDQRVILLQVAGPCTPPCENCIPFPEQARVDAGGLRARPEPAESLQRHHGHPIRTSGLDGGEPGDPGCPGRVVRKLVGGVLPAGYHVARWDRTSQSNDRVMPGLYFYRIRTGSFEGHRRMIVLP